MQDQLAQRRAISTIVGMFFFMVVMAGAFTAFILMMEANTDFLEAQVRVSQHEIDKIQEKFSALIQTEPYRNPSGNVIGGFNKFNLTVLVENTGKNHVEIVDLWIINKTLPDGKECQTHSSKPCEAKLIEIHPSDAFIPIRTTVNVLENTPVTLERGRYDLKLVTALGNTEIIPFRVGGPPLLLKLVTSPPNVANLGNLTLTYIITNNSTKTFYDVKLFENENGEFATITPSTAIQGDNAYQILGQSVIPQLDPNESGVLTVTYKLTGAKGSKITFTTNVTAKKELDSIDWDIFSNNETVTITMEEQSGGAFGALRQKPEIFIVIPGPAGESFGDSDRGYFGVIIINPTNQTMIIHRVSLFAAQGGGGTQVVTIADEDSFDHISPIGKWACSGSSKTGSGPVDVVLNGEVIGGTADAYSAGSDGIYDPIGRYTFPENNLIVWTNDDLCNPIEVQPTSSQGFIFRVKTTPQADLTAFIVGANAHTSMGQFSTIGHTSSAIDSEASATMVNVYPTSKDVSGGSLANDPKDLDFIATGTIDALEQGRVFNVTIREGHTDSANYLPASTSLGTAKLILKLPPGFPEFNTVCCLPSPPHGTNPANTPFCQYGFDTSKITSREFRDGAIQVEVPLAQNLGDATHGSTLTSSTGYAHCTPITASCSRSGTDANECHAERFTFQFSVNGPDLEQDEVYVYYAFADGRDVFNNPIGPVSEAIVLRVNGKQGICFNENPGTVKEVIDEFTGKPAYKPNTNPPEAYTITCE
jgi:hypothetical protein